MTQAKRRLESYSQSEPLSKPQPQPQAQMPAQAQIQEQQEQDQGQPQGQTEAQVQTQAQTPLQNEAQLHRFNATQDQALMSHHAKSFAAPTLLLGKAQRQRITRLYALCRTADDLADEAPFAEGQARLAAIFHDLESPKPKQAVAVAARELFDGRPAGLDAFKRMIAGMREDLGPRELDNLSEVERFADAVAGTVGEMICALFDVPGHMHAEAIALGRAMQLTNLCRDVYEDAGRGRRYLPGSLCSSSAEAIRSGDPEARAACAVATLELLKYADQLYAQGRTGLHALPFRLRLAVAIASRWYQAIAWQIRRCGGDPAAPRAYVTRADKVKLLWVGVADAIGAKPPKTS